MVNVLLAALPVLARGRLGLNVVRGQQQAAEDHRKNLAERHGAAGLEG